ncbi:MAG: FtsW/RodA/SpoVE family cell cycle protein, partial [Clostridiales bacterium]|nr:FtsW/RodA/SpoVE family cell cycle protein [Clostridiales bacterium]
LLSQSSDFKHLVKVAILAACHVLILVLQRDLGGALIFYVAFLIMLYVATKKAYYFFTGLVAGSLASYLAYNLFSHVRVRVIAWQDPFSVIDNEGYQVSQSLFAISTGGWFGMGLTQGLPESIPIVDSDFIFSAISEEMGGIYAICLILINITTLIMSYNISAKIQGKFYKLVALGLSSMLGFQGFLSIGGVTKFIPSTGVTLPFISYGGSSLLSCAIMFAIIQGLFILNQDRTQEDRKEDGNPSLD